MASSKQNATFKNLQHCNICW